MGNMDVIEEMVRSRMAQKAREEWKEFMERHPEYEEQYTKAFRQYKMELMEYAIKSAIGSIIEIESTVDKMSIIEKSIEGLRETEEYVVETLPLELLITPFLYEKMFDRKSEIYLKPIDEHKKEFEEEYIDSLTTEVFNREMLKSAVEIIYGHLKSHDVIISRLTEIAKQDGIKNAMWDETISSVIRGTFPTPDSYKQFVEDEIAGEKRALELIGRSLDVGKARDEREAFVVEYTKTQFIKFNPILDMLHDAKRRFAYEQIAKIYQERK